MAGAHDIPARERLIFALDLPDAAEARALVEELGDAVHFYKLGLELIMGGQYFRMLDWLAKRRKKIFVDLKFFDIPATVAAAVRQLRDRGVSFATVHGNQAIMQAAALAKGDVRILAVTVLTSLDRGDLDDLGFQCDVAELVQSRARRALEAGCDGVLAAALDVSRLRETLGQKLLIVTPGVLPVDNRPDDEQKGAMSVASLLKTGADYVVIGRSIRDAREPRVAAEQVQREIALALR